MQIRPVSTPVVAPRSTAARVETPPDQRAGSVEPLPSRPSFPPPPTVSHALTDRLAGATLAAAGAPGAAAALALVPPETGRDYTVSTTWKGQPYQIPVRFGSLFSRWCAKHGNQVDLERLQLVKPDGSRVSFLGTEVAQKYREATGREAHPWLQFDPTLEVFGLPTQPVRLDLRPDGVFSLTTGGLPNVDFAYKRERPYVEAPPTASELEAMPPEPWMGQPLQGPGDAYLYGRTPELRARCAEIFEEVCGKAARAGVLNGPPLHVFPVPDDKHWTAMPTVHQIQDGLLAMGDTAHGKSNIYDAGKALLVFVPESDLAGPGYALRHELYHALEHKYLDETQKATLDDCHQELVKKGGPFESVYGYQRHEFLTTMAEEFEGEHGPDGPGWLRQEHPRVYALLREVTGRG